MDLIAGFAVDKAMRLMKQCDVTSFSESSQMNSQIEIEMSEIITNIENFISIEIHFEAKAMRFAKSQRPQTIVG